MIRSREFRDTLKNLAGDIAERAPYGSALAMSKKSLTISIDSKNRSIEEKTFGSGVVFRAFDGSLFEEYSTNDISIDSLKDGVRNFLSTLSISNSGAEMGPFGRDLPSLGTADFDTPVMLDPRDIPLDQKVDTFEELKEVLLSLDKAVKDVRVSYSESRETSTFVDEKSDLSQEIIRTEIALVAYANARGKTVYDYLIHGGTTGYEIISFSAEDLERLKVNLKSLLSAKFIEPGTYPIITSPSTTGIIAHESFGHGVETDLFLKRNAKAKFYMDKEIASPLVVMKDDPSLPGGYGTYFFDDEGILSRPTKIIDDGILRCGLSDLYSARALGVAATGNGRRESYARKTYARMSNTFIEPQQATLDELMSTAGSGIYLESPSGGIEDPQGWGIQITVKLGREFKKGKFTGKVFSPVAITGYVPDLLKSISGIGNDFSMSPGHCGKGYKEMIRVGIGGPHILARCRLG